MSISGTCYIKLFSMYDLHLSPGGEKIGVDVDESVEDMSMDLQSE